MKIVLYFILIVSVFCWNKIEVVRRGNVFQQLMFLSGLSVNELFYKLAMRLLLLVYCC